MKRPTRKDPSEKKERLVGCFWEGGGRSGFDDVGRAHALATSWRMVADLERRRMARLEAQYATSQFDAFIQGRAWRA